MSKFAIYCPMRGLLSGTTPVGEPVFVKSWDNVVEFDDELEAQVAADLAEAVVLPMNQKPLQ